MALKGNLHLCSKWPQAFYTCRHWRQWRNETLSYRFLLVSPSWHRLQTIGNKGKSALYLHLEALQWHIDKTSCLPPSIFVSLVGPVAPSLKVKDSSPYTGQPDGRIEEEKYKKMRYFLSQTDAEKLVHVILSSCPKNYLKCPELIEPKLHLLLLDRNPVQGCRVECARSPRSPPQASDKCSCWCLNTLKYQLLL